MNPMRQPWAALATLVFLLLMGWAQLATYYPAMPAKMATSFDFAGKPKDWAGKDQFSLTYAGLLLVIGGVFAGLAWATKKIPARLVSLPNKDYWLAPERRDETCRFLSVYLLWMGNATLVFLMAMLHATMVANWRSPPELGLSLWRPLAGFLLFVAVWCVLLCWRFKRPRVD